MSGISQATGILAARDGVWEAVEAATAHRGVDIDRYYAPPAEILATRWVAMEDVSVDPDLVNIGPRRQFDESIRVGISVGAWVAASGNREADGRAAFDAAYGILAEIQTHITQTDITLGGAVLWCLPGSMSTAGVQDPEGGGYVVEIQTEFVCAHRVRPT
ncbi:hypothetical protein J2X55_002392 [Microbacterium sp. 1154]|uniref:hypothetical protein n=1 Tax=Microbacterium sp. 1154 TaxID=2817733 RepID=UPI002867A4BB|nr:hypothetical protein [Microbacterium sp. 1154]MDR6691469.1 hypothetical protein [Microbacterium sp. 1154]